MLATVNTSEGSFRKRIKSVKTNLTEKQLDRLRNKFNDEVRVLEYEAGVTYTFQRGARFIKSSSLDELFEMYKAAETNQPIPERICHFIKDYIPPSKRKAA